MHSSRLVLKYRISSRSSLDYITKVTSEHVMSHPSMACHSLGCRTRREHQISNKGSYSYSKHDPTIICHKQQPIAFISFASLTRGRTHMMKNE